MQAAREILVSLLKSDRQKTAMSVIRHTRATLHVYQDKTIEPQALIREILPMLPKSTQRILQVYLDDDELFIDIWDELDDIQPSRCGCFA